MVQRRPAATAAAGVVAPPTRMGADSRVRSLDTPDLGQAQRSLDGAIHQLSYRCDQLVAEAAAANPPQGQLLKVQTDIDALLRLRGGLRQLDQLAGALQRRPGATAEDAQRLAALIGQAGSRTPVRMLDQITLAAEDLVRNVGRDVPSDRGLKAATTQLVAQRSELGDRKAGLAQLAADADLNQPQLLAVQRTVRDCDQQIKQLDRLKVQADRLAANPAADPAAVAQVRDLLAAAASPKLTTAQLTELVLKAETAATPNADPALASARMDLLNAAASEGFRQNAVLSELESADLTPAELITGDQRQREIGARQAQLTQLNDLAGRMNRPGVSAADREALVRLLGQAANARTGGELQTLTTAAEQLVRDAGRATPSDPGLNQALAKFSRQITELADRQTQLAESLPTANLSKAELLQSQVALDDLRRDAASLEGIANQAKRVADDPRASADSIAQAKRLLHLSTGATGHALLRLEADRP